MKTVPPLHLALSQMKSKAIALKLLKDNPWSECRLFDLDSKVSPMARDQGVLKLGVGGGCVDGVCAFMCVLYVRVGDTADCVVAGTVFPY